MGARGIDHHRNGAGPIEGLGHSKHAFLMNGPFGSHGQIGKKFCPYKTEAAARKDWRTYRAELMAAEERCRRPWAFWEYELEMDCPSPVCEQWRAIRDLDLAVVAVARKLAVILHTMWIDGTEFCMQAQETA